jgi:hypothetical protein
MLFDIHTAGPIIRFSGTLEEARARCESELSGALAARPGNYGVWEATADGWFYTVRTARAARCKASVFLQPLEGDDTSDTVGNVNASLRAERYLDDAAAALRDGRTDDARVLLSCAAEVARPLGNYGRLPTQLARTAEAIAAADRRDARMRAEYEAAYARGEDLMGQHYGRNL